MRLRLPEGLAGKWTVYRLVSDGRRGSEMRVLSVHRTKRSAMERARALNALWAKDGGLACFGVYHRAN